MRLRNSKNTAENRNDATGAAQFVKDANQIIPHRVFGQIGLQRSLVASHVARRFSAQTKPRIIPMAVFATRAATRGGLPIVAPVIVLCRGSLPGSAFVLEGVISRDAPCCGGNIWIPQPALLGDEEDMDEIAAVWTKIQKHAKELM